MEELVPIFIVVTYVLFHVLERVFPARPLPKVRFWLLTGVIAFVVTTAVNAVVPAIVAGLVAPYAPLRLGGLGTGLGALAAFLTTQLIGYGVHRSLHRFRPLWRWTHQMHHSAERIDMSGAALFHPFDIAVQAGTTTAAVALLGVTPDAAALAGMVGVFCALFQHLNVRTPRWLGYLIQRPESHSIHHARGVHAYNYADLPLVDLLFGTFRNPEGFEARAGFWDGASARVGAMLAGRDVSDPLPARETPSGAQSAA